MGNRGIQSLLVALQTKFYIINFYKAIIMSMNDQ